MKIPLTKEIMRGILYLDTYKEGFVMEMEIAALSMAMASSNVQNSLSVGMLKKTMDSQEQAMETIIDMMDKMPSPDGRGKLLDVRV